MYRVYFLVIYCAQLLKKLKNTGLEKVSMLFKSAVKITFCRFYMQKKIAGQFVV